MIDRWTNSVGFTKCKIEMDRKSATKPAKSRPSRKEAYTVFVLL